MSDDRFLELAPLAALGALDGDDLLAFRAHAAGCAACQAEIRAHEDVAGLLGLATGAVPPPRGLRGRVLGAVGVPPPSFVVPTRPVARRSAWPTLAAAASVLLALAGGYATGTRGRDEARRQVAQLQEEREGLLVQLRAAQAETLSAQQRVAQEVVFHDLVAHGETRIARLAAQPSAPGAQARIVWNPTAKETVLMATGLKPPPAGKAYELWVIAGAKPVPAGVFKADERGRAVVWLPWRDDTVRVKTFAVTLEPEAGVPVPTGPMVLAGAVS
jgi:anti-sigma-K factor RskA/putative zinc finger protein